MRCRALGPLPPLTGGDREAPVHHAGADIGCFSTLWGGTLIRSDQPSAVRFFAQGIPVLYAARVITGATEKGTQRRSPRGVAGVVHPRGRATATGAPHGRC